MAGRVIEHLHRAPLRFEACDGVMELLFVEREEGARRAKIGLGIEAMQFVGDVLEHDDLVTKKRIRSRWRSGSSTSVRAWRNRALSSSKIIPERNSSRIGSDAAIAASSSFIAATWAGVQIDSAMIWRR